MSARPESALLRRARQADLAAHSLRLADVLALALGYGLMLSTCVGGFIAAVDWIQGNPQTVLPEIVALLRRFD